MEGRVIMPGRESGKSVTSELMGETVAGRLVASAESGTFGADVAGYAIDQVFGGIWERPGLDRRARSLVTMAVMVAMRQPNEFSIHMNIALNIGVELKEIEEALIQILPYVGYPAVATALAAASAVLKERGLDTKSDYSGHRGLL